MYSETPIRDVIIDVASEGSSGFLSKTSLQVKNFRSSSRFTLIHLLLGFSTIFSIIYIFGMTPAPIHYSSHSVRNIYSQNNIKIENRNPPFQNNIPIIPDKTNDIEEKISSSLSLSPSEQISSSSEAISSSDRDEIDDHKIIKMPSEKQMIAQALKYAWDSYRKLCWGQDELQPTSRNCANPFTLGLTIIDSIDSLYIMELYDEYNQAKDWITDSFNPNQPKDVSVFETTIRVLGGLLSIHSLSGESIFLEKAKEIGSRLWPAFSTKNGLAQSFIHLQSGRSHSAQWASGLILAEVATLQLEFSYLGFHTQQNHMIEIPHKAIPTLFSQNTQIKGLIPVFFNAEGRFTSSKISFGALGDSAYEYLLKSWLLLGKDQTPSGRAYRRYYLDAINNMIKHLIQPTDDDNYYLAELERGSLIHKMDHLACFTPGLLTLGVISGVCETEEEKNKHINVAKKLMNTCVRMYLSQATGIAPEFVRFVKGKMFPGADWYILRPETVESLFYLYRYTHDPIYRQHGWSIFQSIQHYCRGPNGFSSLKKVNTDNPIQYGKQESFFMAETLKYLYLLFSSDNVIPLDKYVFNTESHPISILPQAIDVFYNPFNSIQS